MFDSLANAILSQISKTTKICATTTDYVYANISFNRSLFTVDYWLNASSYQSKFHRMRDT